MFTGIVEEVGTVRAARPGRLTIAAQKVLEDTKPGDSIAVNGACLTVVELWGDSFSVDVMPETLRRTNLGLLRPGDGVNLERSLAVGGRMGGPFVEG
ncbi:MAG: riboflavin synthase subunit alpha, partial [Dehalococcoidia bacterium DG_18]